MEVDTADQMERIVAVLGAHPLASVFAVLAICIILGFQKDGLFSRYLAYLEARETREAAKEERRIHIVDMLEARNQYSLPGMESEKEEREQ